MIENDKGEHCVACLNMLKFVWPLMIVTYMFSFLSDGSLDKIHFIASGVNKNGP
jgi:hypothetical protein